MVLWFYWFYIISTTVQALEVIHPQNSSLYDGSCHILACEDVEDRSAGRKLIRKASKMLGEDECKPNLVRCNEKLRNNGKTLLQKLDIKHSAKKEIILLYKNGDTPIPVARTNYRNNKKKNSPKKLVEYVRKMDKPSPLSKIRSQADLHEKCRKYCFILLTKTVLSKQSQAYLKRLRKVFRNVRFGVVDLNNFSVDWPDWLPARPDPVLDDSGNKMWPVFVNRLSPSKRRELSIVPVPPAVDPSTLSLHTDPKIRLSTCRNQIRDALLRGNASPLEIANIFELNVLDSENVSPLELKLDNMVIRIKNRYYSYESAASLMFSSYIVDIDDSTAKALTRRYPLVTSNRIIRYAISAFSSSSSFNVADVKDFLKSQLLSPENIGPTSLKIRKKRKKKKSEKNKKKKKSPGKGTKSTKIKKTTRSTKEEDDISRREAERQRREEMMAQEMEFVPQAAEDVLDEEEWRELFEDDEACEDGDYEDEDNVEEDDNDDEFDDVIEL
jgi:hypothetical protein